MEVSDSTRGTKKNSRERERERERERGKALAGARESGTRSSVADQSRERNESRVNRTRTSVMPPKRAKTAKKTEKKLKAANEQLEQAKREIAILKGEQPAEDEQQEAAGEKRPREEENEV